MKAIMLFMCMALTSISVDAKEFFSEETTVTESVVLFDQDKHKISGDGIKKLGKLPIGETEVIGFASSEGAYEYNLALSKRRANAVSGVLNRPSTVTALGESDANPIMDALDRKVVIIVTSTELVYSPIFGEYDYVLGPVQHLLWNTLPLPMK